MKRGILSFYLPLGFLILLAGICLFAPWIAPYPPQEEHRSEAFHPPVRLHWRHDDGRFSLQPFVYATRMSFDENYRRNYTEDRSQAYPVGLGDGRLLGVEEPARLYLMGADSRGRDIFSRILYGARVSLSIGLFGALCSALAGLAAGSAAGYFGGRIDGFLMRIAEFFIMIPGFYLLLALRSVLPPGLGSTYIYFLTIGVLSLIGWGGAARVIRGLVLSIRQQDFISAARVLGRSHGSIILRHVIPHTLGYLAVVITISVPSFILTESALSVLGLGIQEPAVSWGSLLGEALSVAHLRLHPWVLLPGVFLFLTAWSFHALGDRLSAGLSHETDHPV